MGKPRSEWTEDEIEKNRRYQKKYREDHSEKTKEYKAEWYKNAKASGTLKKQANKPSKKRSEMTDEEKERIRERERISARIRTERGGEALKAKRAEKRREKKTRDRNNERYYLWIAANPEKQKSIIKSYRERNRDKIRARNKETRKERYLSDKEYRIKAMIRAGLSSALKAQNTSKNSSAVKLLGCTVPEFINYITSKFKEGMSWDRREEFHLDHVRPCASFNLTIPEEVAECFHYTNYQPLWASENLSKNSKWNGIKWRHKENTKNANV